MLNTAADKNKVSHTRQTNILRLLKLNKYTGILQATPS